MKTSEEMREELFQRYRRNWLEMERLRRMQIRRRLNHFLNFLPSAGIQGKTPGRC